MRKEAVYLDACIWIAESKGELTAAQTAGMAALYRQIEQGSLVVVASTFLYTEVLTVAVETLELAFDGRKGISVALDDEIARAVRNFEQACFDQHGMIFAPSDAIHLCTAANMKCRRFVTLAKTRKGNQLSPLADHEIVARRLKLQVVSPEFFTYSA